MAAAEAVVARGDAREPAVQEDWVPAALLMRWASEVMEEMVAAGAVAVMAAAVQADLPMPYTGMTQPWIQLAISCQMAQVVREDQRHQDGVRSVEHIRVMPVLQVPQAIYINTGLPHNENFFSSA